MGQKIRSCLALWVGILVMAAVLSAQGEEEKKSLTIQEAVELAVERNYQVVSARARTDALKGKIKEVRAEALPSLSFNTSGMRWRDPAFLNSSSFDKIPEEFKQGLVPIGANLFDYHLSLSQPLYTSGKVGTALKLASLESEGVEVDRAKVEQEIRLKVIRAFYGLLLAERQREVVRDTVKQREQHLAVARARRQAGVATEVDVLRSEVNLANAQPELIRAENGVRLARSVLNNLLVRPTDFPTEAVGELTFALPAKEKLGEVVREALLRRPELQRLRLNEREADEQIRLAQAESRLRIDFNGLYGFSARDPANLWNHNFTRWMFTFNVGLPLFDGGRRSGLIQQALANRKVTQAFRFETEDAVRLEAQSALDELERAERTVQAARLNVEQAQRVLTMMQDNYRYGAATTLDVVDAQTALSTARGYLLQGLHDHTLARAQLRYVMGWNPLGNEDAQSKP